MKLFVLTLLVLVAVSSQWKLAHWMSDIVEESKNKLGDLPLIHWTIVGSHDAGCFLDEKDGQISDFDSLETERKGYKGQNLLPSFTAVTQHLNLRKQLRMGARYLDLRYKDEKGEMVINHSLFKFWKATETFSELKQFAADVESNSKCEIVWLRIKLQGGSTSEKLPKEPSPAVKSFITALKTLNSGNSRIRSWAGVENKLKTLTYNQVCTSKKQKGGIQKFKGVYFFVTLAEGKSDMARHVMAALGKLVVVESTVMEGKAPTRRNVNEVLSGQVDTVKEWQKQTIPTKFHRVYLTSTGTAGGVSIWANSHGIWNFVLPTMIEAFNSKGELKEWSKAQEAKPPIPHEDLNAANIQKVIVPKKKKEVKASSTIAAVSLTDIKLWAQPNGYLQMSNTHVIVTDYCENSCPFATYLGIQYTLKRLEHYKKP